MSARLFIVFLRRPGKDDRRTDPFWEFGSFGCTGCHDDNLLNPKKRHLETDDRLAFVQGGPQGCKLLLITPPVKRKDHGTTKVEIRWDRSAKPFRYASARAPVLTKPGMKNSVLVELGKLVNTANRSTASGKLASRFRTRCQPLDGKAAQELLRLFERARDGAAPADFIEHYTDALPRPDYRLSMKERRREYADLLAKLNASPSSARCRPERRGCHR